MLDRLTYRRRSLLALPGAMLAALIALAGCGSSSDSGTPSGGKTTDAGLDAPPIDAAGDTNVQPDATDGGTDAPSADTGADTGADAPSADAGADAQDDGATEAEASTPPTCTEITAGTFAIGSYDGAASYFFAPITPDMDTAEADSLSLELYGPNFEASMDGDKTGTFALGMGDDANYMTCSRCVRLAVDPSVPGRLFFQQSGTLAIDASSDQLNGKIKATLTDVTLVEVTIDTSTFESTPVPGGACLHIASATVDAAPIPPPMGWTCDPKFYADAHCDCGCGVLDDKDCTDSTVGSCEYCDDQGSCSTATGCPGTIDPANNAVCTP